MTDEILETANLETDIKLIKYFPGRVVRKDLTKLLKVGHNVPVCLCAGISSWLLLCRR